MRALRSCLFLLLLVIVQPINAQVDYFNRIYSQHAASAAHAVIEKDSFYIIAGNLIDSSANPHQNVFIKKFAKNGDIIFTKSWGENGKQYTIGGNTSLINTSDNGFVMVGSIKDSTNFYYSFLTKFNSNCDTLWTKYFYDTISQFNYNHLGFSSIKETYDKGFIIIGEIYASHQYDEDIFLIKTDSSGNTEWYKTYGYISTVDRGSSIIQTPDSGFVIGGNVWNMSLNYASDAYIIRTDKDGNLLWEKFLGGQYSDLYAFVSLSYDSNYIVGFSDTYEENSPYPPRRGITIMKITPSKQMVWIKNYQIHNDNILENLFELNDHNILLVGISNIIDTINMAYGHEGFVMKLTEIGDSLWYRDYSYQSYLANGEDNILTDLTPTKDGGILACGYFTNYFQPIPQSIWLVKTDSLGCDTPGCITVGVKEPEELWSYDPVSIYPNPVSDFLNIEVNIPLQGNLQLELYDFYGRIVKELKISKPRMIISLIRLEKGLYFYRIRSSNRVIDKGKVLVVR